MGWVCLRVASFACASQFEKQGLLLLVQAASQPEKEDTAISTAERLQEEGVLRCFGAGRQASTLSPLWLRYTHSANWQHPLSVSET